MTQLVSKSYTYKVHVATKLNDTCIIIAHTQHMHFTKGSYTRCTIVHTTSCNMYIITV